MSNNLDEETIVRAYRAALRYGPEPFNNDRKASYLMISEMADFLFAMESADSFETKAYYVAGKYGVDICCVDWMQDVAEESDGIHDFCDNLFEGYDS